MAAFDRLAWAAVVASLAVAPGCSSGSSGRAATDGAAQDEALDGGDLDATVEAAPPTYAPTFTAIYGEILMPICAGPFCHGVNEFLLMTTKDVAYHAMVGVKSFGPKCGDSGLTIVEPDDPDASLFYLKVTTPPCGNRMPNGYYPPLDTKQTTQIHDWIAQGALNN